MSFLATVLITILETYLALSNSLAAAIEEYLPVAEPAPLETTLPLTEVASQFSSIPTILLDRASEQGASAIGATDQNRYAENPLEAVVNVFCTYERDGQERATTGSGFMVDSDGIVLTNAHVAQFLLLEGVWGESNCVVRTGSPAIAAYEAELLYISPAWILENAASFMTATPRGTGERDYALLYITESIDDQPLPRHFPALRIATEELPLTSRGQAVTAAGYPAESAFSEFGAAGELGAATATTTIAELATFGSNRPDLFSVRGTPIGEQGVSGGPIIDANGVAIGIISTRGDDIRFGEGSLRALTLSYIARTYTEETTLTFTQGLSGNLPYRAKLFGDTMTPILRLILEQQLE